MMLHKPLVLVIGDDIRMQQLIREILEMSEYNVLTAYDQHEAISALREAGPDLILLEGVMPAVDGYALCRRIRELSETPLMIIVEGNSEDEGLRALDAGANDYLTKPFSHIELTTRVKTLLGRGALINGKPLPELCYDKPFPLRLIMDTYSLCEGNCHQGFSPTSPGNAGPLSNNRN